MADESQGMAGGQPKKDTVLQNTQDGYVETSVDELPLSDATGEGRKRPRQE